jgi:hypothetical protein
MKKCLSPESFILYATQTYNNPTCTGIEEFYEDLQKIKYVKRLLIRYKRGGDLKERLILNHIITLQNVFGAEACSRMLFYKISKDLHSILKSFLQYLHYLPYEIPEINLKEINTDHRVDKVLKDIK